MSDALLSFSSGHSLVSNIITTLPVDINDQPNAYIESHLYTFPISSTITFSDITIVKFEDININIDVTSLSWTRFTVSCGEYLYRRHNNGGDSSYNIAYYDPEIKEFDGDGSCAFNISSATYTTSFKSPGKDPVFSNNEQYMEMLTNFTCDSIPFIMVYAHRGTSSMQLNIRITGTIKLYGISI